MTAKWTNKNELNPKKNWNQCNDITCHCEYECLRSKVWFEELVMDVDSQFGWQMMPHLVAQYNNKKSGGCSIN